MDVVEILPRRGLAPQYTFLGMYHVTATSVLLKLHKAVYHIADNTAVRRYVGTVLPCAANVIGLREGGK